MAKKETKLTMWIVACEGHTDAWVNAPDWAQATVKAAEFWGVPWREVAAQCECRMKKQAVKGVCPPVRPILLRRGEAVRRVRGGGAGRRAQSAPVPEEPVQTHKEGRERSVCRYVRAC